MLDAIEQEGPSRFLPHRSGGFKLQMLDEWNAPQFFVLTKQIDNLQKLGQDCNISNHPAPLPGWWHLHIAMSHGAAFVCRLITSVIACNNRLSKEGSPEFGASEMRGPESRSCRSCHVPVAEEATTCSTTVTICCGRQRPRKVRISTQRREDRTQNSTSSNASLLLGVWGWWAFRVGQKLGRSDSSRRFYSGQEPQLRFNAEPASTVPTSSESCRKPLKPALGGIPRQYT